MLTNQNDIHDGIKSSTGRPWRRWEDNIKLDLKEIGIDRVSRIEQGQVAGFYEYGDEPLGSIKKAGEFLMS